MAGRGACAFCSRLQDCRLQLQRPKLPAPSEQSLLSLNFKLHGCTVLRASRDSSGIRVTTHREISVQLSRFCFRELPYSQGFRILSETMDGPGEGQFGALESLSHSLFSSGSS